MKLLTKELIRKIPGPRAQENVADPMAYCKFFSCGNGWTWWVTEAWQVVVDAATGDFIEERALKEPLKPGEKVEDIIFMGKVAGIETELGTFSLNELQSVRGIMGLGVERDIHWQPKLLSQCTGAGT